MGKIFISYRREDSKGETGRIWDRLVDALGRDVLFRDIDEIPFGVDFRQHVNQALDDCDLVLVVIGRRWLDATDSHGNRRLDDPADFVRLELEGALARDAKIIPVLLDGTSMPGADKLPPSLSDIAYRNAAEIDMGRDFASHIERLIAAIRATLGLAAQSGSATPAPAPSPAKARHYRPSSFAGYAALTVSVLTLLGLGTVAYLAFYDETRTADTSELAEGQKAEVATLLERAEKAIRAGKFEEAERHIRGAEALSPKSDRVRGTRQAYEKAVAEAKKLQAAELARKRKAEAERKRLAALRKAEAEKKRLAALRKAEEEKKRRAEEAAKKNKNLPLRCVILKSADWRQTKTRRGPVQQAKQGLLLRGAAWTNGRMKNGYHDGNGVISAATFDFRSGGRAQIKFAVFGDKKYMAITSWMAPGMSASTLSTHNVWANSMVVPERKWLFAEAIADANGSYRLTISHFGFGQTPFATFKGRLRKRAIRMKVEFGDNYAGTRAWLLIARAEVCTAITSGSARRR